MQLGAGPAVIAAQCHVGPGRNFVPKFAFLPAFSNALGSNKDDFVFDRILDAVTSIQANSVRLAFEQGQWGWTNIRKSGRSLCAIIVRGATPFEPGVSS